MTIFTLTLSEYLQLLRESVQPQSPTISTPSKRCFNSTHFWRQAYSDPQHNYDLCSSQRSLVPSDVSTTQGPNASKGIAQLSKRKRQPEALSRSKGAKSQVSEQTTAERILAEVQELDSNGKRPVSVPIPPLQLLTASDLTPLARYIFEFGMLLRLRPAPVEALAGAIARSCTHCIEELSKVLTGVPSVDISSHLSSTHRPIAHEEIESVLRTIRPIIKLSIVSVICLTVDEKLMAHAVYAVAHLFNAVLEAFHSMVQSSIVNVASYPEKQSGIGRQERGRNRPESDSLVNPSELYSSFTVVLSAIIESLDPNEPSYNSLRESVACVLLEYVGKTLGIVTFPDPDRLEDDERNVARVAALREAPYLVYTLNKLVTLPGPESIPESPITAHLQMRLQNTVLRGVFGKNDEDFFDCLKHPTMPKIPLTSLESMTEFSLDSPEWFAERVWSLVGWNLLKNSIAQDEDLMETDHSHADEDSLDPISLTESTDTTSDPPLAVFCYCQAAEHERMVACNSSSCRFRQFHLECLGLKKRMAGYKSWICGDCRRQSH